MPSKVVLTCDRTMASVYHDNPFFGFSACLPQGTLPDWFYYPVFCPSGPADKEGKLLFANYGMRKVEAALLAACWDHNLDWFPRLWVNYGRDNTLLMKAIIGLLLRFATEPIRKRVHCSARRHGAKV